MLSLPDNAAARPAACKRLERSFQSYDMIISHEHRYVFIELPMTGSTAVARELLATYDGTEILYKHATYGEFLRVANDDEKKYFVFSSIRNPLDQAVSHYFKFLTDHQEQFTRDDRFQRKGIHKFAYNFSHMKRYEFVRDEEANFGKFFRKFYRVPYDNWSAIAHKDFDFLIRFETLQDDFHEALKRIGLERKRELPQRNKTGEKKKDFSQYYDTPELVERAKWVFAPYMKRWGYEFPQDWGEHRIGLRQALAFRAADLFRKFYWHFIRRPNQNRVVSQTTRPALEESTGIKAER